MAGPSSPFLDRVRKDFADVHLNPEEFGKEIEWNGHKMTAVEDGRTEADKIYTHGIYVRLRRFVFLDTAFGELPLPGEQVRLDGDVLFVRTVEPHFGHLIVTLGDKED